MIICFNNWWKYTCNRESNYWHECLKESKRKSHFHGILCFNTFLRYTCAYRYSECICCYRECEEEYCDECQCNIEKYTNYLPRPAARPGRCLFGGENVVAHFPNLLPPAGPNREVFATTGGILFISRASTSSICSSSRSWSCVVIV